ncbi:hypothetical protein DENSPDRAFT_558901 [Dentipellis sp. KUC8613]|nr:hypothetical protein DENSPDRAFT_558901 [Dentipellis sp. KUC8613]
MRRCAKGTRREGDYCMHTAAVRSMEKAQRRMVNIGEGNNSPPRLIDHFHDERHAKLLMPASALSGTLPTMPLVHWHRDLAGHTLHAAYGDISEINRLRKEASPSLENLRVHPTVQTFPRAISCPAFLRP